MGDYKVVVTDDRFGSYDAEESVFKDHQVCLEVRNFSSEEEAVEGLAGAHGVLCNLFPLTERIIATLTECKIISRYGVGYDNVDLEAATRMGIWVSRVTDYANEEVAEHTLALLLGVIRGVTFRDKRIREGEWNLHRECRSNRIFGSTLGIVGYGGTGQALHRKVSGLGFARVLIHDPTERPEYIQERGGEKVALSQLIAESDYVTLHVPLKSTTRGMIGEAEIRSMKRGAILINTSRGGIVDEVALAAAVERGCVAGAGVDVFLDEPIGLENPLLRSDRIILSDHCGWYSEQSVLELKSKAAEEVLVALLGEPPPGRINKI